jgi:cytoskeletal protein CcmA (bactofilin family)
MSSQLRNVGFTFGRSQGMLCWAPFRIAAMPEKSATNGTPSPVQGTVRTVLFPDSAISGRLSYDLPVKIDSKFTGEVKASDLLVVGANAHVEARIAARNLQLEGKLIGSVQVMGCFEIMPGGHFKGDVQAAELKVHPGATFDGQGKITGEL